MFFLISKFLAFLVNPVFWLIVLLFYVWLGKREGLKRRLIKIAVVLLFLFSNPFLFDEIMRLWEVPAVSVQSLHVYDAGVVLGTTSRYDKKLDRIQFIQSGDRLFQAIELYKKGKIRKILYSGGSGSLLHPDEIDGPWIKRYLVTIGIPEKDIIIENISRNTFENAVMAKPILDRIAPNGKYLLITSAYHMRRSLRCFAKAGISIDPYSTDRISGPSKYELGYLFIPDTFTFASWYLLYHEVLGFVFYKISGYI
jgi:uncharacterized SAM-binding protein YcdF (DUF218 family)